MYRVIGVLTDNAFCVLSVTILAYLPHVLWFCGLKCAFSCSRVMIKAKTFAALFSSRTHPAAIPNLLQYIPMPFRSPPMFPPRRERFRNLASMAFLSNASRAMSPTLLSPKSFLAWNFKFHTVKLGVSLLETGGHLLGWFLEKTCQKQRKTPRARRSAASRSYICEPTIVHP